MDKSKLQQAIEALSIEDVYICDSFAKCHESFNPKHFTDIDQLDLQSMHIVHKSQVQEVEGDGKLLQIYIRLGARWVDPEDKADEPQVFAIIEAEYIAEYRLKSELEQACIDEFAHQNASFHVWPYWREYLASQCERLRLPRVMLPATQFSRQDT